VFTRAPIALNLIQSQMNPINILTTHLTSLILLFTSSLNDQVKEDEMGRACSTHGAKEESV
jgi:hypothetical protein